MRKRELVVLLCLSSWCLEIHGSVALSHGATGLSAVCDCGMPLPYSLKLFFMNIWSSMPRCVQNEKVL